MPTRARRFEKAPFPDAVAQYPLVTCMSLIPFAAVWLIIAVLLMSAYGVQPHAITVDLPPPGEPFAQGPLSRTANLLSIDRNGRVTWNSEWVSVAALKPILQRTLEENPQPALHFAPLAEASYGDVVRLLNVVAEAGLIDACFVFSDTWRYRRYEVRQPDSATPPAQHSGCNLPYVY